MFRRLLVLFVMIVGALTLAGAALAADSVSTDNNLEMWSFIVGAFLPPLVAILMQPRWSRAWRSVVGVASSVIAAGVTTYFVGDFDLDKDLVGSVLRVVIASQATYMAFWKPTTVAPGIESATSGRA